MAVLTEDYTWIVDPIDVSIARMRFSASSGCRFNQS